MLPALMRVDPNQIGHIGLDTFIETIPPNTSMVEVGCFLGESTEMFALCKNVDKIVAVDPYDFNYPDIQSLVHAYPATEVRAQFENTVVAKYADKITFIPLQSVVAAKQFPDGTFDLVYLDGAHDTVSVISDIEAWLPKIKKGGRISGHDYHDHCGVKQAVTAKLGSPHFVFPDTSWVVQL